ncbi:MAG TPA: D-alanyl-D-alanine carboxypeptidase family protein, partial [Actinomycetota bacterium]|nr:D-alanyl-D-alanine carboxypeptidase family protein [Actinomycetota bacterium]
SEGRWMQANAHRFGFVLSYPARRDDVSCYGYEPWHFRYFGRAMAKRIHSSGLTPREYLWRLEQRGTAN